MLRNMITPRSAVDSKFRCSAWLGSFAFIELKNGYGVALL